MANRLVGPLILVLWASSMSWLVAHDLWPAWTAQDVPLVGFDQILQRHRGVKMQAGIYDAEGERIGGIWSEYNGEDIVTRDDMLHLHDLPLVGPILLVARSDFLPSGELLGFKLDVHGAGIPINIEGERFHSQFAIAIRAGGYHQAIDLDQAFSGMIGDCFRPFSALRDLRVGQTWRMQVFNPLAVVTRNGDPFVPLLVRVTEQSTIPHGDRLVECFVVHAPGVTAWVDRDGTVLEQQAEIPLLGRITVRDEPYDERLYKQASALLPRRQAGFTLDH